MAHFPNYPSEYRPQHFYIEHAELAAQLNEDNSKANQDAFDANLWRAWTHYQENDTSYHQLAVDEADRRKIPVEFGDYIPLRMKQAGAASTEAWKRTDPDQPDVGTHRQAIREKIAEAGAVDWREAIYAVSALTPGTVVNGFEKIEEVDIFVTNLGHTLNRWAGPSTRLPDKALAGNSGRSVYRDWYALSKPPSEAMRPKKFLGELKNMQVVMLEDGLSENENPTKEFVLFAEMHSTGVGSRGTVAKRCQVGTFNNSGVITVNYKNLRSVDSPEKIADAIIEASSETSRQVVINGLRHAIKAGLPGLGKRR